MFIHSCTFCNFFILVRVMVDVEVMPECWGMRQKYSLDGMLFQLLPCLGRCKKTREPRGSPHRHRNNMYTDHKSQEQTTDPRVYSIKNMEGTTLKKVYLAPTVSCSAPGVLDTGHYSSSLDCSYMEAHSSCSHLWDSVLISPYNIPPGHSHEHWVYTNFLLASARGRIKYKELKQ